MKSATMGAAPRPHPGTQSADPFRALHDRGQALQDSLSSLRPYLPYMRSIADLMGPAFARLDLQLTPEIILGMALQEASPQCPATTIACDGGLGIMRLTPYRRKFESSVARILDWDNRRSIAENRRFSQWRDPHTNIWAAVEMLRVKAVAIKNAVDPQWRQMSETQRWHAVFFAYNAGQGAALRVLRRRGAAALALPQPTHLGGAYIRELQDKLTFAATHTPFPTPRRNLSATPSRPTP